MAEHPDMVFSPVAYLADCGHLSDAEHGRYFLMLQHMWLAPNRRFPNDDAWLARKFRRTVAEVVEQLRPLLAEFFQTDGNWLRHKRLDRDWDRLAKTRAKQSARAKCRWNKGNDESRGNAEHAMHSGIATLHLPAEPAETLGGAAVEAGEGDYKVLPPCPPVSPLSPVPPFPPLSPQPSISNPTLGARAREPDGFAEWYASYPRKVGRQAAAAAYRKALGRTSAEELADGLARARLAWKRRGTPNEYIPHPATWLNEGRWSDDDFPNGNPGNTNGGGRKSYIDTVRENLAEKDEDYDQGHETLFGMSRSTSFLRPSREDDDPGGYVHTRPYLRTVAGGL